jgi:3-methyl-2-oxobutanoate hydroxymethyltransferase
MVRRAGCQAGENSRASKVFESGSISSLFSLGSGNAGDAIFLFMSDICGESVSPLKHAHAFGNRAPLHQKMYEERVAALKKFHAESTAMRFPYTKQSIMMHVGEEEKLLEELDKL